MAKIITSGIDYAQFFDDLRAVIRHEIRQSQKVEREGEPFSKKLEGSSGLKNKRQVRKEVANG